MRNSRMRKAVRKVNINLNKEKYEEIMDKLDLVEESMAITQVKINMLRKKMMTE